jgi:hypothetical protein
MRQTLVWDKDLEVLVPKYGRNYFERHEKHADLPSPAVHPGGMRPIKSMADGRMYETKRNYYRSVSRAGCEIVGHDKDWQRHIRKPGPTDAEREADIVKDVQAAIEIEQSKVPSYGPEARRLMRRQRRAERAAKA